jgi:hypothetical protein
MSGDLQTLTTVQNEFEADMVLGALSDAGIHAVQRLAGAGVAGRFGGGGQRDVCVAEEDLERARDVLERSSAG